MNRGQRRAEEAWDHLTALLIARREQTGQGLDSRGVRDLIDEGRDTGLSVEDFCATRTITGTPPRMSSDVRLIDLLNGQWPISAYRFCADLGDLAQDCGAFVVKFAYAEMSRPDRAWRLAHIAETASRGGARWADLVSWLEVLAQVCDPVEGDAVWSAVLNWDGRRRGQGMSTYRDDSLAEWAQVLGPAVAWAWAADVPIEDVEARKRAGILDEAGLLTLAVLRGYRLTSPGPVGAGRHNGRHVC